MNKKRKIALKEVLVVFLFIGFFIAWQYFFFNVPAIAISCEDGEFKGFTTNQMPAACMACIPYCYGEVNVYSQSGDLICNNSYKEFSNVVPVPCENLKEYKNQPLTIKYKTDGLNNTFNREIIKIYNG